MKISCTVSSVSFNGVTLHCGTPLDQYRFVLGEPSRTDDLGPPAPFGHRNNQVHFYDDLGVFLAEHHLTRLIEGVGIVLDADHAYRQPRANFGGELVVCGVRVEQGMRPEAFLEQCAVPFRWHLGHSMVFDAAKLSIDIDTYAEKTRSGRNSRRRQISVVSIGFKNAHLLSEAKKWDTVPDDSIV